MQVPPEAGKGKERGSPLHSTRRKAALLRILTSVEVSKLHHVKCVWL